MNISVVIPVFNGKKLLEKYLPSIIEACKNYSFEKTELIIVDDASSDGTKDYIESNFPFVKIIRQDINMGFSASANNGIFSVKNRIVVLLNTDVKIENDFLAFLPEHFENNDVFAVRPGLKNNQKETVLDNPKVAGGFKYGFFDVPKSTGKKLTVAFFAGGGASAYDKEKFMELGGFDDIFSPFYYEDVDLSYRAWKRGWKIIYEPRSLAQHRGGATISKFYKSDYINIISERNKYFLVWKNIADKNLLFQHFIFVPIRLFISVLTARYGCLKGLFAAFRQLSLIINKRKLEKQLAKVSDREIFSQFK
ncbi:MAG: glycosyltransferase family 2 protein [Elusimicrobia bacterium]|nr:glycosyltransferase family 2 protein [Elusimicrobiota bacterium]